MKWILFKMFQEGDIQGLRIIHLQSVSDTRGEFVKFEPQLEFQGRFNSVAYSKNPNLGTLRGLHFQVEPYAEEKLVSCIQGAIFDVLVDLREDSPSFGCWSSLEISSENSRQVYIPKGVAHGFQTLRADSIVQYCLTSTYSNESAFSLSPFNNLGLEWPIPNPLVSPRDLAGISFSEAYQLYSKSLMK